MFRPVQRNKKNQKLYKISKKVYFDKKNKKHQLFGRQKEKK